MTNLGEQLLQPEQGWKRIDDRNDKIKYVGTGWKRNDPNYHAGYNNSTLTYTDTVNDFAVLYVYTKNIRFIAPKYNNRPDADMIEVFDDTKSIGKFSNYGDMMLSCLLFEYNFDTIGYHKITLKNISPNGKFLDMDSIDIDEDGYLLTEEEYLNVIKQEKPKDFPVKISDDTITSEDDIAVYAAALTNGERQLLIADKLNSLYITQGNGNYKEIARHIILENTSPVKDTSEIQDTPIGHMMSFMGAKAPKHYLICDGKEYNIKDYPKLSNFFQDEFGIINYFGGNGITTFAVPNIDKTFDVITFNFEENDPKDSIHIANMDVAQNEYFEKMSDNKFKVIKDFKCKITGRVTSYKTASSSTSEGEFYLNEQKMLFYKAPSLEINSTASEQKQFNLKVGDIFYFKTPSGSGYPKQLGTIDIEYKLISVTCIKYEPTYYISYGSEIETSNILDKATYDTNNDGIVDKASIAKKIENIESAPLFSVYGKSPNGEMGFYEFPIGVINDETNKFQSVKQNVNENQIYTIDLTTTNKLNDLIVQVYEFIQDEQNVVSTLKKFNNCDSDNFYYDKDNLEFTDEGVKIKNKYEITSTLNTKTNLYEMNLNKEYFTNDITNIHTEVIK